MARSVRSVVTYDIDQSLAIQVDKDIPSNVDPIYFSVGLYYSSAKEQLQPGMKIELYHYYQPVGSTEISVPDTAQKTSYTISEDDLEPLGGPEEMYKLFAFKPAEPGYNLMIKGYILTKTGSIHQILKYGEYNGSDTIPQLKKIVIGDDGDKVLVPTEIEHVTEGPEHKELVRVEIQLPENFPSDQNIILDINTAPEMSNKVHYVTSADRDAGVVVVYVPAPAEGKELTVSAVAVDRHTNRSRPLTENALRDDGVDPEVGLELNTVAGDDVINAAEAARDVVVSGRVTGDAKEGDVVTIRVNGKEFTATVDANKEFSVNVPGADLVADPDHRIEASITVSVEKYGVTKQASANADHSYTVNTALPEAAIELDNITLDNVINAQEAKGTLTLTGRVGGDLKQGDVVQIQLDENNVVSATVNADKTFSVELNNSQVQVLVNKGTKEITATATPRDESGNETTVTATKTYEVDTTGPDVKVTLDKITGDNIVTTKEANVGVVLSGKVTGEFSEGDVVKIFVGPESKGVYFSAKVDANGNFSKTLDKNAATKYLLTNTEAHAVLEKTDAAGNVTKAVGDQAYTVKAAEVGETISLVRLDGDLTQYSGISKTYLSRNDYGYSIAKGGDGKAAHGTPFTLTDKDDTLLIGWELKAGQTDASSESNLTAIYHNNHGTEKNVGGAGNFMNWADNGTARNWDSMDGYSNGSSISTIDTGRGDDIVRIRGHQQQASRAYLGEGDDTYVLTGKLTAAQAGGKTSAAIFGENGNDNISVGSDVNQSYIIGGSGSDTITIGGSIYGNSIIAVDNDTSLTGGAYVSHYKFLQAYGLGNDTARDTASDVNSITVNGDVGLGVGTVQLRGSDGQDTITIKGTMTKALVETFDGNDVLSIGAINTNMMTKIDMGAGKDTIKITGAGNTLDLTKVFGVEVVDLTGTGKNLVKVTATNLGQNSGLHVKGNADDVVDIVAKFAKTGATDVVDGVTYNAYSVAGTSELVYVQEGLSVI